MDSSRLSVRRHGPRPAVRTLKLATAAALGLGLAAGVLGSSLPAQAQGAAPAQAAHAVVHRAAVTAATEAMPFRWDKGAQVKATVVTAAQAKVLKGTALSGYQASAREWASTQRVLPDGRVVGVTGGTVKVQERGGSVRNYYSGTLKGEITYISVQGSTFFAIGMVKGGVNLYVLKGTGTKPSVKTFLPTENQWANPVLVGGKVYYDRYLLKNHAVIGAEVVSVPLYGSKATVLVKNARDV
ncbi:hypothetical protein DWB68_11685 [Galactobacter valiniphilus]|uniref:Htaa domain-containing protein n=1 Tax=Galactobacter valiniphilus TaxID=2676122 RepID=A0A399J8L4_9MICC|nr:hypothetical protein [Galactobacter valiniphilus]RII41604.1 hypothetical protein DWB68_11685 [Galactobacter valiniphilus]